MLGVLQYAQDYDECFPKCWTVIGSNNYASPMWYEAIEPYCKNTQILTCPSDKSTYPGYGMNYINMGSYGTVVCLGDVKRPAEVLFLADQYREHSCCIYASQSAAQPYLHWGHEPTHGGVGTRHNDGANVGFCDGHCKWLKDSNFDDYRLWANIP